MLCSDCRKTQTVPKDFPPMVSFSLVQGGVPSMRKQPKGRDDFKREIDQAAF
jgi:hypothetical protein